MLNINNLTVSHDLDAEAMRAVCGGADRSDLVYGIFISNQYDVPTETRSSIPVMPNQGTIGFPNRM